MIVTTPLVFLIATISVCCITAAAVSITAIPIKRDYLPFTETKYVNTRFFYTLSNNYSEGDNSGEGEKTTTATVNTKNIISPSEIKVDFIDLLKFDNTLIQNRVLVISYNNVELISKYISIFSSPVVVVVVWANDYGVSNFSEEFKNILECKNITHVFAQNLDVFYVPGTPMSNKISPIPLGIDYHTKYFTFDSQSMGASLNNIKKTFTNNPVKSVLPIDQETELIEVASKLPNPVDRPPKAYTTAHLNPTDKNNTRHSYGGHRENLKDIFIKSSEFVILEESPKSRRETWVKHGEALFIISPPGKGLDCHRTWEALVLGNIPIVISAAGLSKVFEDLPVIEVSSYEEVTSENLKSWKETFVSNYNDGVYNFNKLTNSYWRDLILSEGKEMG